MKKRSLIRNEMEVNKHRMCGLTDSKVNKLVSKEILRAARKKNEINACV